MTIRIFNIDIIVVIIIQMNFQTSNFEFLRNKNSTKSSFIFKLKFTEKKKKKIFFCIFQRN